MDVGSMLEKFCNFILYFRFFFYSFLFEKIPYITHRMYQIDKLKGLEIFSFALFSLFDGYTKCGDIFKQIQEGSCLLEANKMWS